MRRTDESRVKYSFARSGERITAKGFSEVNTALNGKRKIIHVDMDAFFAAVEVRDNPSLAGKPLIIGALPTERGVVSTCSYEARKFGIRSAINIKEAYRRCPDGVFMHGNMHKYAEASSKIHEIMLKYTDVIEFVALDEGYMDVTASEKLFGGAEKIGRQLKAEIFESVGVTCSVGISYCMMGAKLASEEKKPNGFFIIPDSAALVSLIADRPVGVINGIGKKTAEKLNAIGIYTVAQLAAQTETAMVRMFGVHGAEIRRFAHGDDRREVIADSAAKSIGREHTFQTDITDKEVLRDALHLLSAAVAYRAKKSGVWGKTVTLKIKLSDMRSITRARSGDAVNSAKEIYAISREILDKQSFSMPVRLIGVSLSNLRDSKEEKFRQLSLFDETDAAAERSRRSEALDNVVFSLNNTYGKGILQTGKELEIRKKFSKNGAIPPERDKDKNGHEG